ncbi:uridylate kinase [Methylocystis sp. B8]|uniref:amino acid kinase family protein n=1 Tax=Methylocystis sp. B8 TaxID=544938 RepID=UPI0010FE68E7|nr:uridylate kinase [Methylocystis sp. B8]TLG78659.1 uridylate kinase [Methylocystis sp. B8]
MPSNSAPLVVKFGGSLHASPALGDWLTALKRCPRPLTIVPGGGPFADAVRAAQSAMRYDEKTAHAMAVLAMEQYALALASRDSTLELADSLDAIQAAQAQGRIALWRPSAMVAAADDVAPCWGVTSDSLAAWLAKKTRAGALLLIKSVDVGDGASLSEIIRKGVVDPALPDYLDGTPLFIAGPSFLPRATAVLADGMLPGATISTFPTRKSA